MKRILAVLCVITILCMTTVSVCAASEADESSVINLGVGGELPDSDPENDRINAEKMARLKQAAAEGGQRTENEYVRITCPTRPQITSYWCGLASAEQVIRASGNPNNLTASYGSVPFYTTSSTPVVSGYYHQFTINDYLGGVSSGVEPDKITSAINHFSTDSFSWGYRHISGNGVNAGRDVLSLARQTIGVDGKCCVVFADTTYYSYYDTTCYHWVTLNGYSYHVDNVEINSANPGVGENAPSTRDQVELVSFLIVDPHYNTAYQGAHSINSFYSMGMAIERYNNKPNIVW